MDTRRIALALVAALLIASGATWFLYSKMKAQRSSRPDTVKVVAAAQTLPAGAPLAAQSVTLIDWPDSVKLEGSYSKTEDVLGRSLIYPVTQNQPILASDVASPGSGIGLT